MIVLVYKAQHLMYPLKVFDILVDWQGFFFAMRDTILSRWIRHFGSLLQQRFFTHLKVLKSSKPGNLTNSSSRLSWLCILDIL